MEKLYFTRVHNGETQLHEVNFKTTLDPEVLMGTVLIQNKKHFDWDGRSFTHRMYASEGLLTHVIHCLDHLYWQLPLRYDAEADKFYVNKGEPKDTQYKVGIKNCVIIVHTGDRMRSNYNMYIATPENRVPQVVNIFDDGRLCVHSTFSPYTDPRNIITTLEESPGNNHLLVNRDTGVADERNSSIPIFRKNGIVFVHPFEQRKLNHEQIKYLRDIHD